MDEKIISRISQDYQFHSHFSLLDMFWEILGYEWKKSCYGIFPELFNSFQVTTPKSHTDLLSKLILMVLARNSIRLIFNFVQL